MKTIADRLDSSLDDALEMTFPASDPIAVFIPLDTTEIRIERPIAARPQAATRADPASTDIAERFVTPRTPPPGHTA